MCFEFGSGVAKDIAEAARLYKLAADQGHVLALSSFGKLLYIIAILLSTSYCVGSFIVQV